MKWVEAKQYDLICSPAPRLSGQFTSRSARTDTIMIKIGFTSSWTQRLVVILLKEVLTNTPSISFTSFQICMQHFYHQPKDSRVLWNLLPRYYVSHTSPPKHSVMISPCPLSATRTPTQPVKDMSICMPPPRARALACNPRIYLAKPGPH